MDERALRSVFSRAIQSLKAGRPEMASAMAMSPAARYTDAGQFDRERALFRRHPQAIAASTSLARPGDWVATRVADMPVLLVRGSDGRLRAFVNVCRHRGAELAACGSGAGRDRFVCPYHAWTYAADGHLVGLPKDWGFPNLDRTQRGLQPLAVAEQAGLVWVVLDPALRDADVVGMLGPLANELDAFGLASSVAYGARTITVEANWKLIVDGTLEAYHFKVAHRDTIAARFADNLQVVDEIGLNRRLFLVREKMRRRLDHAEPPSSLLGYGSILYHFFPATFLLVNADHTQVFRIVPDGINRSQVHDLALIPGPGESEQPEDHWRGNVALYHKTIGEDYALIESIQRGLSSGANQSFVFRAFEQFPARFHEQVEELTGPGTSAEPMR